jgi:uncharacterized protein
VIFVDSSYWIALRTTADRYHTQAAELWQSYGSGPILTSSLIRGETWTFIRRRRGHSSAVHFLDSLEHSPRLRVVPISESLEMEALSWLRRRDERSYSFVDATSFMLMQSLGIREALAFDGDFSAAGFVELRP